MRVDEGIDSVELLVRRWKRDLVWLRTMQALALSVVIAVVLYKFTSLSPAWSAVLFILLSGTFTFADPRWKMTPSEVSRFLSRHFPELEESSHLLLRQRGSLGTLESLQRLKVEEKLGALQPASPVRQALRRAAMGLAASLLISALLAWVNFKPVFKDKQTTGKPETFSPIIAATVQSVNIIIRAPAYTGKAERAQHDMDLEAEEGSMIQWTIMTNKRVTLPRLFFSDSSAVDFVASDSGGQTWKATRRLDHAWFYQLGLAGEKSAFYRLEMIRDEAPRISIRSPKSYTVIDYGMPLKLPLFMTVSDDYGVTDVRLVTTISSGNGEAVKFSEQETPLPANFSAHLSQYDLGKTMDLASMGMHPGDELYFYAKATDNHRQETRSDVYIVSLPDTAELLSLEGLVLPVNVNPEFFRSQRQIIIETEQLLREIDTLREATWKDRSNNLGIDQKLLRLRYGKFLGEENESNQLHDGEETVSDPKDFGNAQKVLDQFTDKHDNAEDASYFDSDTKNQLKATLTEMWNSELKLRTFNPREALPYEYKALRLLKDLQQKSRAYVAKTGSRTTPLNAEKRLSGDLSKILQPVSEQQNLKSEEYNSRMPEALALLEKLKTGAKAESADKRLLSEALQLVTARAAAEPGAFLLSMQSLQKIIDQLNKEREPAQNDLAIASAGLYKLIQVPSPQPGERRKKIEDDLGEQYFKNLSSPR